MRNKKVYEPIDLGTLKTLAIDERKDGASVQDFIKPAEDTLRGWLAGMPPAPVMEDLRGLAGAIARAHNGDRPVGLAFGPDLVRSGLSPIAIDLMERGILVAVATGSAGATDDIEIAFHGATARDLADEIKRGKFGPVEETSGYINDAALLGRHRGLGQAIGDLVNEDVEEFPHGQQSILAAASRLDCAATVHVAPGTDAVHLHPQFDAANVATASFIDFRKLCAVVADMRQGIWLNVGYVGVPAEAFAVAVGVARAMGANIDGLIVAAFCEGTHCGPTMDVIERAGYSCRTFTGGCEIMLPVLHQLILMELDTQA